MSEKSLTIGTDSALASQKPQKVKGPIDRVLSIIREILAIFFWLYVIVKLLIFDIDQFLIERTAPSYAWVLNFKFFIITGTLAVIWLFTKSKHILSWAAYVLFYPLFFLLWKVSFFIFKQKSWIFAFAVINAAISFFKSVKYNFVTAVFYLVSLALVFGFSDERLIWPAIGLILIILFIIYFNRFILVFKPSSIFQLHSKFFAGIRKMSAQSFSLDVTIKNLPVTSLDQKQMEKWVASLQQSILFNRACLFASKKLRDYQNSGLNIVSYVLTILLLIIITIFSFAVINLGLFKISSSHFSFSDEPSFFTFFYYSFNNLLFNGIKEIAPSSVISQSTSMLESLFAFFVVVIFVSLLLSVRSQRHAEELGEVILAIEKQGEEMESFIKNEYKLNSIEEAMAELEKIKEGAAKFLYKITEIIGS